jgi:subtilisin family serine protease
MRERCLSDIGCLVVLLVLSKPCCAKATEIEHLQSLAAERGSVHVLVQLDEAIRGDAGRRSGPTLAPKQLRSAALAEQLAGTEWNMTREFHMVPYVALEVSPAALDVLARSPVVTAISEDRLESPAELAGVNPIAQTGSAFQSDYDGTGWAIAILDTGVHAANPYLAGKVVSGACYSANGNCPNGQTTQVGPGAGETCSYALEECAHGTHVAGIAAGHNDTISGVAPGAAIISIQVFSRFTGSDCQSVGEDPCALSYTSDTIAALERVYDLRETYNIAAVNMSLGG